jgi:hypothetical protein
MKVTPLAQDVIHGIGGWAGDAGVRLNGPVDGWAPALHWPVQNRRICTVARLPELDWAIDHNGGSARDYATCGKAARDRRTPGFGLDCR